MLSFGLCQGQPSPCGLERSLRRGKVQHELTRVASPGGAVLVAARQTLGASALVLLVFAVDARFQSHLPGPLLRAGMDEAAHLATALLCLWCLWPRAPRGFAVGVAVGGVLIDVDHLPAEAGWDLFTIGTKRPYSHSLLTILIILLLARWLAQPDRVVAYGVAFGVAAHLLRDMADGGVPLFWPETAHTVPVSYEIYTVLLVAMAARVVVSAWWTAVATVLAPRT